MKLIAISDDRWTTVALFSIAGEEYFFQHSKTPDIMSVQTKAGEELHFTRSQCEDILKDLKTRSKKQAPINHWKQSNAQDDDEYYRRGRG